MRKTYEVTSGTDRRAIAELVKREGQFMLPMVELVERTELAIDEVVQVMGRATIEAVLEMSAEGVAGPKQSGKARADGTPVWYGRQGGQVYLSDRKVRVERPRLRERSGGEGAEVEVPAYAAMRRPGALADRMLEILMAGVSTRKYGQVIGEMADTVGVSKSSVRPRDDRSVGASAEGTDGAKPRRMGSVGDLSGRHPTRYAPRTCGCRRGHGRQEACAGDAAWSE